MSNRAFLDAFKDAFAERFAAVEDAAKMFDGAENKTSFMVGSGTDTVLGLALSKYVNSIGLNVSVHKEWYTIDLMAVSPAVNPKSGQHYWSTRTVVTIEHENGNDVETEMWKLAHWNSPMSVLVFYDYNEDTKNTSKNRSNWLVGKLNTLSEIVKSVDSHGAQRHLLIIGNKNIEGILLWQYSLWVNNQFSAPTPL